MYVDRCVLGLLTAVLIVAPAVAGEDVARGVVFHDADGNGIRGLSESGVAGVGVSNGVDVTTTDGSGRYEIPINDRGVVFVIKPSGWMVRVDPVYQLPRFYHLHRPTGSPAWTFVPGVAPTGPLPSSVDFPLVPQDESAGFTAIVMGDPQPRNMLEIDYLRRDVIAPMIANGLGEAAAFGVTLGDLTFDVLHLFEPQNRVIARLGVPWFNVIGNHDINTGMANRFDDESFERVFGPPNHAFRWGDAAFLVLDNIYSTGAGWEPRFGDDTVRFARNVIAGARDARLVVAMAHCPLGSVKDRVAMLDALHDPEGPVDRRVLFLTAHRHEHFHEFWGVDRGWHGSEPLHHIVHATASGSWWGGDRDARGIPDATMSCGAPNGFSLLHIDRGRYRTEFHGASEPASFQMRIEPATEPLDRSAAVVAVSVNVFNGNERSRVAARAVVQRGDEAVLPWVDLVPDRESRHVWVGELPVPRGADVVGVEARTVDMFGVTYSAQQNFNTNVRP